VRPRLRLASRRRDGNETIELYHVDGLNHSDNMLVAYLPKEKILINADLYTPAAQGAAAPANVSPNAVALFQNVKRLKLDVAQHVPIHGNPGGNADFERIVGSVAARAPQQGGGADLCHQASGRHALVVLGNLGH
jgi:hypothetical protein